MADRARWPGLSRVLVWRLQKEGGVVELSGQQQTNVTPSFTRAPDGTTCDVCGTDNDVCQIIGLALVNPQTGEGYPSVANLCSRCMAAAIEAVTGFRARRVVASWYKARDNARVYSLTPKGEALLDGKG